MKVSLIQNVTNLSTLKQYSPDRAYKYLKIVSFGCFLLINIIRILILILLLIKKWFLLTNRVGLEEMGGLNSLLCSLMRLFFFYSFKITMEPNWKIIKIKDILTLQVRHNNMHRLIQSSSTPGTPQDFGEPSI